jgi:hypothetical protein
MKRKIDEIPMDVGFYKNLKHEKNQTVSKWGETYRLPSNEKCASNKTFMEITFFFLSRKTNLTTTHLLCIIKAGETGKLCA